MKELTQLDRNLLFDDHLLGFELSPIAGRGDFEKLGNYMQ